MAEALEATEDINFHIYNYTVAFENLRLRYWWLIPIAIGIEATEKIHFTLY